MKNTIAALMLVLSLPAWAGYFDDHPLTANDVALYLQVMDKAAARAAVQRAGQKPCPTMPNTKNHTPTQADMAQMTAAANCMANAASVLSTDDAVAKEMGVTAKYEPVRDAIESLVQYDLSRKDGIGPGGMAAGGCGGDDCDPTGGHATAAQKALWAKQAAMADRNKAFLQPYRSKIQHDQFLVRQMPK